MKIEKIYSRYLESGLVDTDTRKIRNNSLFFALKGANFDGNKFVLEALKKGAKYAISDDSTLSGNDRIIIVKNVLTTLQCLARHHRNQLNIPVLGLTGSNGKTTTKELISAVLSTKFKTVATKGNLNNHIGVPLTILSIPRDTEMAIVEMGANHLKEIEDLCTIARPSFGYITNFGKAHLEGFGSEDGVIQGKSELYDSLRQNNGIAFINYDDKVQIEKSKGLEIQLIKKETMPLVNTVPFLSLRYKNIIINSKLIGAYNYSNIAAAIAIGHYFGVTTEQIKSGIERYTPTNNRSQILTKKRLNIVLDAYNANPSSMEAALSSFSKHECDSKTVILGDMFELGKNSDQEHQYIADFAAALNFTAVHLIGKAFSTVTAKNAFKYESFQEFSKQFQSKKPKSGALLIKGSRGMELERVLDLL